MPRRWFGALVVLAVLVVTGILAVISGSNSHDGSASRAGTIPKAVQSTTPTTTFKGTNPVNAGMPLGSWSLSQPSATVATVGVGFPHTVLGGVALGYNYLSAYVTVNPDLAASAVRATALQPSQADLQYAAQQTEQGRTHFGLPATGPTSGVISLSLEACRVTQVTNDRLVVGYEGTLVVEGAGIQGTSEGFAKSLAVAWNGSDWKVDLNAPQAPPPLALPGTSNASSDGWHGCQER